MVISSDEVIRRRSDLEMRISKMISEGGMAVDAHYFHDKELADWRDEMAKAKMVSEGGLGAELYYYNDSDMQKAL